MLTRRRMRMSSLPPEGEYVFAVDEYLAVGGRVQAVDAADERGLARAAHADDAVDLALFDLQTHAAEGHDLAARHGIDLFKSRNSINGCATICSSFPGLQYKSRSA